VKQPQRMKRKRTKTSTGAAVKKVI
jgi:hypothetical protein